MGGGPGPMMPRTGDGLAEEEARNQASVTPDRLCLPSAVLGFVISGGLLAAGLPR